VFYQHRCPPGSPTLIPTQDVENYPVAIPLVRDDIVLCTGFVTRDRKRYAVMRHKRSDHHEDVTLYLRVSRLNRSSSHWREMNAMLVIACAEKLPTL